MQIYLLNGGILFHFAEEAGADEGIEAEVLLALAGFWVNGCIGFGQPNAKFGGYIILYLRLRYSCMSVIT